MAHMDVNKQGVPYHRYSLTLEDGTEKTMDVGYEEDWGHVQQCAPDDCDGWENAVGWGDDECGHVKIISVVDEESGKKKNVRKWAERCVWSYVGNYSS